MILDKANVQKNSDKKEIELILKLFNSNKINEAEKKIKEQFKKNRKSPILFNILGAILVNKNNIDQAIVNYKKSIELDPNYAQAYNNLGIAFHKIHKTDEAIIHYKRAIELNKNFAEFFYNLGNALRDQNKFTKSIEYFQKAIEIKSTYAEAFNSLALSQEDLGKKKEAVENYKKAIKIKPDFAEAYNNLGKLYIDMLEFNESLSCIKTAIKLKPSYEKAYNSLGNILHNLGRFDDATEAFEKAINIKTDYATAYSNLLFNLNYKLNFNSEYYLSVAKKFSKNCKPIKKKLSFNYNYEKKPKKIKLGLMSADFGNHPGGYFTLSTLREIKKKNFELIAYSTADRNDEFSFHFRPLFSKWHSIETKTDEEVVGQIFKDGIHILIDLQGHSAKNRLPVFIHKPAPIQATWLGQGSTGISEIDYFIGSKHITPKAEQNHYVEEIISLPEISQCFTTPDFDLNINSLPAIKNKFITFGCVNKITKINDEVISLWSKILTLVSNAKIIIKNKDLNNQEISESILLKFEKNNINRNRIILEGQSKTRKELLEIYSKIDICLDPFPFQGNTSTIEAIWMGVPVIVLKGNRYLFHFGESINSNLKMYDWIAENYEDYISKTIKLSSNIDNLSEIRKNLRSKAINSPIFDSKRFGDNFSKILWDMWKKFELKQ